MRGAPGRSDDPSAAAGHQHRGSRRGLPPFFPDGRVPGGAGERGSAPWPRLLQACPLCHVLAFWHVLAVCPVCVCPLPRTYSLARASSWHVVAVWHVLGVWHVFAIWRVFATRSELAMCHVLAICHVFAIATCCPLARACHQSHTCCLLYAPAVASHTRSVCNAQQLRVLEENRGRAVQWGTMQCAVMQCQHVQWGWMPFGFTVPPVPVPCQCVGVLTHVLEGEGDADRNCPASAELTRPTRPVDCKGWSRTNFT